MKSSILIMWLSLFCLHSIISKPNEGNELLKTKLLCIVSSFNRPDLESAIFETCMISTFIIQSFESK